MGQEGQEGQEEEGPVDDERTRNAINARVMRARLDTEQRIRLAMGDELVRSDIQFRVLQARLDAERVMRERAQYRVAATEQKTRQLLANVRRHIQSISGRGGGGVRLPNPPQIGL